MLILLIPALTWRASASIDFDPSYAKAYNQSTADKIRFTQPGDDSVHYTVTVGENDKPIEFKGRMSMFVTWSDGDGGKLPPPPGSDATHLVDFSRIPAKAQGMLQRRTVILQYVLEAKKTGPGATKLRLPDGTSLLKEATSDWKTVRQGQVSVTLAPNATGTAWTGTVDFPTYCKVEPNAMVGFRGSLKLPAKKDQ